MFKQVPLSYDFDALEPYIDAETMELHYTGHYKTYTDTLNELYTKGKDMKNPDYAHACGGWFNHGFFFENLIPPNQEIPKFALLLKDQVQKMKNLIRGSGYIWLHKYEGQPYLTVTENQKLPDIRENLIFNIDMWEHAYYLKHRNNPSKYIDAVFHVMDWEKIGSILWK